MRSERPFTRGDIVDRLRMTLSMGKPIVAASASVGIVAKCAEIAGIDMLFVLCSGRSRHFGISTTDRLGNATQMTLDMYPEIHNVTFRTPVIGGAEASDGTRHRLDEVVDAFQAVKFDGITNYPATGWVARTDVNEGPEREAELIRIAHGRDIFTVGMAFTPQHSRLLALAGADMIVARVGATQGGFTGPKAEDLERYAKIVSEGPVSRPMSIFTTVEKASAQCQAIFANARRENPKVMLLGQGGPFVTPKDVEYLYEHTMAQGFLGESPIERIPIEEGVARECRIMKDQVLRPSARLVTGPKS
jgi:predicted TIM-barrel enzyme